MELKVWVDGIQRVVCGVSYATTCQDVVLALASSVGQTGRFTLVERWRDTERALIPAEYPLQSLHKWGEYAGEVRYYLTRAGSARVKQQDKSKQKILLPAQKKYQFLHNFTPPETSQCQHYRPGSDLIKRSSTFSGAHNSEYGTSSLSQPSVSAASSQHSCNQQTSAPPNTSNTSRIQHSLFSVVSRGKYAVLSQTSIDSSSPGASSRPFKDIPKIYRSSGMSSEPNPNPSITFRGDARELHPANMPEDVLSHFSQAIDYSSSFCCRQHPSQCSDLVPSPQPISAQQIQHPNQGQAHHSLAESSQPSHSSSLHYCQAAMIAEPPSYQFQQQQCVPSSQLPCPQSSQSHRHIHPVPAPRYQAVLSSPSLDQDSTSAYIKDHQKPPQLKKRSHSSSSHSAPICAPYAHVGPARTSYNGNSEGKNEEVVRTKVSNYYHSQSGQNDTVIHPTEDGVLEMTGECQHLPKNKVLQYLHSADGNTQRKQEAKDIFRSPADSEADNVKSATLDRHFTRSTPGPGLPTRSLIFGEGCDEHRKSGERQLSKLQDQFWQEGEDKKFKSVELAAMKQQGCGTDNSNKRKLSSFASAVAHIRQYCGDELHIPQNSDSVAHMHKYSGNIAHIRQCSEDLVHIYQHKKDALLKQSKTGAHVRQHSSDSSKTDAYFKVLLSQKANMLSARDKNYIDNSNRSASVQSSNQQTENHLLQKSSNKHSMSSSFKSSSLHNSDFMDISSMPSHQELSLSLSLAYACNADAKQYEFHSVIDNTCSSSQNQEISHPKQVSLEIEEKDMDQNFLEILRRDNTGSTGAKEDQQPNLEVCVAPRQTESEHSRLLGITTHEVEESGAKAKLEAVVEEISKFEKQETNSKEELENLDKTEWISVLDREQKLGADIKLQITSLKERMKLVELQLRHLKDEEDKKFIELKSEEERTALEKKESAELRKKIVLEIKQLEDQLASLNNVIEANNQNLTDVDREILMVDMDLSQKEVKVKSIEKDLLNYEVKKHSHTSAHSILPVIPPSNTVFPISESGAVILKILEGQRSAHSSPASPAIDETDNLGGVTSAQHLYMPTMTVKNLSGVWV